MASATNANPSILPYTCLIPRDEFPSLHLIPLPLIDIPSHPQHGPFNLSDHHHPDLATFVQSTLDQGYKWMTTQMFWDEHEHRHGHGRTFTAPKSQSHPSRARVQVCSRILRFHPQPMSNRHRRNPTPGAPGQKEYWFGRRSVHADAAEIGSASFAELWALLKDGHARKEVLYNPGVVKAERRTTYDLSRTTFSGDWSDVTACSKCSMRIYGVCLVISFDVRSSKCNYA